MKTAQTVKIYESPVRLLSLIAVTIFLAHAFVLVLFTFLPHFATWDESIIQSSAFLILLFPALYFFSFRPLILHISERERAEEAMRESEFKYRNLFEHLSDAAFLVDLETGRVIDTNSRGEGLLGRGRGEIMGMKECDMFPPEQEQRFCDRFAAYARRERPADMDTEILPKGGRRVPVHISGVPTVLHNRKLIILFIRELTPKREKKRARRREPLRKAA
jgi:PAS domain S-box-containing protein